jgi:hypothetical protein
MIGGLIIGGIVLVVRRGGDGWNIQFPGVLRAYVALAMLVGVFLVAAGAGLLLKAGFASAGTRDFSYNAQTYTSYAPLSGSDGLAPGAARTEQTIDPSDSAIRDDVASGISLVFVGAVLFAVHAFGATMLRRQHAAGERVVTRAYNLTGLAVATFGFIGTGAQALNDIVRRYVVGGDIAQAFEVRHPGGSLSVAVVLFPLVLWFAWRTWDELGGNGAHDGVRVAPGGAPEATGAA